MSRELNVSVDKTLCVSNLWCVRNLPAVFELDEQGLAEAVAPEKATEADILDAAFNCPVGAISVHDAATGEDLLV